MKSHIMTGGGGVQLHVVETGNPQGRPILFIHGVSQCWLQWSRQMNSSLAEDHRLVALDMRGHGLSDKPHDGYDDSKLWADDVNAVIQTLNLDHPVLSGWSYGPLVFLDYIRHYGEDRLGGLHFVGGVTKLGSEEAMSVLTPEFLSLVPEFLSTDTETSVRGLEGLLRLCFAQEPSASELYLMLGYNVSVPPYVRQGLFSRSFDNDDLLPEDSQACADYAWRRRCDCQTGRRRSAQGGDASRASSADGEYGARSVLGRRGRLQRAPASILQNCSDARTDDAAVSS